MFGRNDAKAHPARAAKTDAIPRNGHEPGAAPSTLLTIVGQQSRVEGKFEIADSVQIECEVGGELAVIKGRYDGNMVATGNVEITATGRVSGNIETDSLVISQGGFFNGNVAKIREHDAMSGPRPVHLVEDKRAGAQK